MDRLDLISADIPRPEYPRPQFVRDTWMNLNGQWDFLFDFGNSGMDRRLWQDDELDKAMRSSAMPVSITVPFCPESRLSGIGYTDWIAAVWYRRRFRLDASQTAGRVLLPFGAIDYHSVIWINGAKAGEHKGGYASFELDVTALVTNGENTVVVYAQDDNRSGIQPCGKQARLYYSNGCDYTRTTGIWQTVWLEFTPREALTYIRITPDVASEAALLDIETVGGHAVEAVASYNGCEVGRACVPLTGGRAHLELRLAQLHLWELGKPELYDLTVSLDTGDTVRSYFGMRSVSLSDTALLLNGRPVFMRTVKDQGFNPGGVDPICQEVFYAVTKEMDRTRPVIDASGGVHFKTDMYDVHDYEQDPAKLKERFDKMLDDPSFVAFGIATDDDKYLTQQYDLFVDSAFIGKRVFSCLIMIFVC